MEGPIKDLTRTLWKLFDGIYSKIDIRNGRTLDSAGAVLVIILLECILILSYFQASE